MDAQLDPLVWLATCFAAAAALGAAILHHQRRHDERRDQAARLVRLLHDYGEWVTAQRLAAAYVGEGPQAALAEAQRLRARWFPELAREMADLLLTHTHLLEFLAAQHALWQRDPQHWIASDHDRRFMVLWRQHRAALHALQQPLRMLAPAQRPQPQQRQSRFA